MSPPFRLCLITNRTLVKSKPMIEIVKEALSAGVDCVLLREPDLKPKMLFYIAKEFRKITKDLGAKLIIKDRIDVAQAVEADGVHLSADSLPPEVVKSLWKGLIGYSAHSIEEIRSVEKDVDYAFLSPIFYTKSKPTLKPLGIDYLKKAIIETNTNVVALGGINEMTAEELKKAKVKAVALMSAFFRNENPKALVKKLLKILED